MEKILIMLGIKDQEQRLVKGFVIDSILIGLLWVLAHTLNYFFNIYIANSLDIRQFAIFGSILGFVYIFSVIGETISSYIIKTVGSIKDTDFSKFRRQLISQLLPYVAILAAGIFAFSPLLAKVFEVDIASVLATVLILVGFVVWGVVRGFYFGRQLLIWAYVLILFEALLKFLIAYFGINYFDNQYPALLAFGLPGLIVSAIAIWQLIKRDREAKDKTMHIKIDMKVPFLIMINLVVFNAIFSFDIAFIDLDLRADYTALSILGKVVFFAASMTIPLMFARVNSTETKSIKKTYITLALVVGLVTGGVLALLFKVFGAEIVELIYGGKYLGILNLLPVYAIGATLFALGLAAVNYSISKGNYGMWKMLLPIFIIQMILLNSVDTLENAILYQTLILAVAGITQVIRLFDFKPKA